MLTKENIVTVYRGAHIWHYDEHGYEWWQVLGNRDCFNEIEYAKEFVDEIAGGKYEYIEIKPNGSVGLKRN